MEIQTLLFRHGIATWITDIITSAATPAAESFQIGKNLPEDVGFIYGLNTIADGIGPDGQPLGTTAQYTNMYINLQTGPTSFVENFRLSDLQNDYAGSPIVRMERYMPVAIPAFDLSKSSYINPNSYTGFNIHLYLWYVNKRDWAKYGKIILSEHHK